MNGFNDISRLVAIFGMLEVAALIAILFTLLDILRELKKGPK